MTIFWTESALSDLATIKAFISRHSVHYADATIERIFDKTEVLASHPLFGSVVPEFGDLSLRELIEYPYRIIYRLLEDRVDIVAVIHGARRLPPTGS